LLFTGLKETPMRRQSTSIRLPIRLRQTFSNEHVAAKRTVYCPPRGETQVLEDCIACAHCAGLMIDDSGRTSFLRCDGVVPEVDPATLPTAPAQLLVSEIMTKSVICVHPELGIEALTALFLEHGISGAPVVDRAGKPIGVVTKTDLVRAYSEAAGGDDGQPLRVRTQSGAEYELGPGFHVEAISRSTVADIMTAMTFALPETSPIGQAAGLMAYEGVHRVPIVSQTGEVVGLLSTLDVMRWLAEREGYRPGAPAT
jgi:CBS domain-containing protein